MKYVFAATWPKGAYDAQKNYTESPADTYAAATAAAAQLAQNGATIGEKKFLPTATWAEAVLEIGAPVQWSFTRVVNKTLRTSTRTGTIAGFSAPNGARANVKQAHGQFTWVEITRLRAADRPSELSEFVTRFS